MYKTTLFIMIFIIVFISGCKDKTNNSSNIKIDNTQTTTSNINLQPNKNISNTKNKTPYFITATVKRVKDGDTVVIAHNSKLYDLRLYGIDTPEKSQPYGPQATGFLKDFILNKEVKLKVYGKDRNSRLLAKIYYNNKDINAEMLRIGAAWHYKYFDKSSDFQYYSDLEQSAKKHKIGLWNRSNPTPPWEYRKQKKQQTPK